MQTREAHQHLLASSDQCHDPAGVAAIAVVPKLDRRRQRALAPRSRAANAVRMLIEYRVHAIEIAKAAAIGQIVCGATLKQQPGVSTSPRPCQNNARSIGWKSTAAYPAGVAGARSVECMDIGAAIEEQRNYIASRRRGGAMKRCPSLSIATVHELRLGIEHALGRASTSFASAVR